MKQDYHESWNVHQNIENICIKNLKHKLKVSLSPEITVKAHGWWLVSTRLVNDNLDSRSPRNSSCYLLYDFMCLCSLMTENLVTITCGVSSVLVCFTCWLFHHSGSFRVVKEAWLECSFLIMLTVVDFAEILFCYIKLVSVFNIQWEAISTHPHTHTRD